MKLSDDLIERLRSSTRPTAARDVCLDEVISQIDPRESGQRTDLGHHNGNGFTTTERISPAAGSSLRQSRFNAQATADIEPITLEWNGPSEEKHWDGDLSGPTPDDHAVLLFQDTMRAFLKTQQEVAAAYLGTSVATGDLLDAGLNDFVIVDARRFRVQAGARALGRRGLPARRRRRGRDAAS